ncbi:MAG TPA: BON domain-containing protein [Burkholderiaceae bacterium]
MPSAPAQTAASADELHNWFDDPFFAISSAIGDCPVPAGPFVDEAVRRSQAHRRAEKGTTCWLAREPDCERSNAFGYDREIALSLQAALRERNPFADTSLWVTVQGRIVYIEGCVARAAQEPELEAFVRALPHVQQAIAIVRTDPAARPPYRLRAPRDAATAR